MDHLRRLKFILYGPVVLLKALINADTTPLIAPSHQIGAPVPFTAFGKPGRTPLLGSRISHRKTQEVKPRFLSKVADAHAVR